MVAAAGWRLDWSGLDPQDNVNRLRSNGVDALTILMDEQAYASYEKYGAWTDQRGQSIPCSPRKLLPYLGGVGTGHVRASDGSRLGSACAASSRSASRCRSRAIW